MNHNPCPNRRLTPFISNALAAAVFGLLALLTVMAGTAQARPVVITPDERALDLTQETEIYTQRGEAFQVSTAPGTDGIVRRISFTAFT